MVVDVTEGRVLVPRYLYGEEWVYSNVFFATAEALESSDEVLRRCGSSKGMTHRGPVGSI